MNRLNINEVDPLPVASATSAAKPSARRLRQGKTSKSNNIQKFRNRLNTQDESSRLAAIGKQYKLFDTDDTKQLETTANSIQLTVQKRAVPLSVTTRSVGFATSIFYDRAASTWTLSAISEIATIHQVYRVHLWLAHFKIFLAQQIQVEPVTLH